MRVNIPFHTPRPPLITKEPPSSLPPQIPKTSRCIFSPLRHHKLHNNLCAINRVFRTSVLIKGGLTMSQVHHIEIHIPPCQRALFPNVLLLLLLNSQSIQRHIRNRIGQHSRRRKAPCVERFNEARPDEMLMTRGWEDRQRSLSKAAVAVATVVTFLLNIVLNECLKSPRSSGSF